MKTRLEVIGAVTVTILILGIPVLSFMSFIHNWDGFLKTVYFICLIVDFLFVSSKLIGDSKGEKDE